MQIYLTQVSNNGGTSAPSNSFTEWGKRQPCLNHLIRLSATSILRKYSGETFTHVDHTGSDGGKSIIVITRNYKIAGTTEVTEDTIMDVENEDGTAADVVDRLGQS